MGLANGILAIVLRYSNVVHELNDSAGSAIVHHCHHRWETDSWFYIGVCCNQTDGQHLFNTNAGNISIGLPLLGHFCLCH